jgi:hypothetical protein
LLLTLYGREVFMRDRLPGSMIAVVTATASVVIPVIEYVVTIEDPTVWVRAWTVKQDFTRQSDQENNVYYESRCIEGNIGLPGLLHGRRAEHCPSSSKLDESRK